MFRSFLVVVVVKLMENWWKINTLGMKMERLMVRKHKKN